ncbi:MAG: hypothetical protein O2868_18750 [Proteobacteria bacterium]|nr:hypothetical protein [Pseudomonadota bacterium]
MGLFLVRVKYCNVTMFASAGTRTPLIFYCCLIVLTMSHSTWVRILIRSNALRS